MAPYHSRSVAILMLHVAGSVADNYKSDSRPQLEENLSLSVKPSRYRSKYITGPLQVVLREICETPFLISTQATELTALIPNEKVARNHACMTANVIMDVYLNRPFYITITNFGNSDVIPHRYKKLGEGPIAPQ